MSREARPTPHADRKSLEDVPAREPRITVCICTHNRSHSLKRTLESLAGCQLTRTVDWELLLVDNNSSDSTASLAHSYASRLPLRYVFEPAEGLSNARNRALDECLAETIVFTDDDVRVEPIWLAEMLKAVDSRPDVDYFGGRILTEWPNGRPRWLRDEGLPLLGGLLVHYDLGTELRDYEPTDPLPFGANMALRRRLFAEVGTFRTELGPIGGTPGRGDDSEYISRSRSHGFSGCYVGTATVYHWTNPKRLTLSYLYRYGIEKGRAEPALHPDRSNRGSRRRQVLYLVRGLGQLAKGRGDRFRQCIINTGIEAGLLENASVHRAQSHPGP
ncbi:MAG: glycosyltransferase [Acidobacteriota bacterium]|nr:glycosyltransferase [Acidobacteriota bacterium]